MIATRRRVLCGCLAAITTGLAGCSSVAHTGATLELDVRQPFAATGTVTVPLAVEISLNGNDTSDVGLGGVDVECYDADFELLGRHSLGDRSWEGAAPDRRSTDRGLFDEQTAYTAEWDLAIDIETGSVPEWITVTIEETWARWGATDSDRSALTTGETEPSAASSVPLRVYASQYDHERPPPPTIVPGDYQSQFVYSRAGRPLAGEGPIVPDGYHPGRELVALHLRLEDRTVSSGSQTEATVTADFADTDREHPVRGATIRSADETIATVEDDRIVGRRPGTVELEATYRDQTAQAMLTVTE